MKKVTVRANLNASAAQEEKKESERAIRYKPMLARVGLSPHADCHRHPIFHEQLPRRFHL